MIYMHLAKIRFKCKNSNYNKKIMYIEFLKKSCGTYDEST